ncbi:hypothetical protein [Yersinia proxima]|uniref:hypothetical protein n=1 Tax=Yersinia proxima TaxID=2890316 RepID=UPI0005E4BB54|nr:hypothetical protein [Yersinia proxima]CNL12879.1 Uncharacterised protein [Yersinia intermedia]
MLLDDESLYSFMFRAQLLHGLRELSNLTHVTGRWKRLPKPHPKLVPYYKIFPKKHLEKLLYSSGFKIDNPLIENHEKLGHVSIENIFFNPYHNVYSSSIPILYCHECIKESIETCGVGYFKKSWVYMDKCKKHQKLLSYLKPTSNLELTIFKVISDVLI